MHQSIAMTSRLWGDAITRKKLSAWWYLFYLVRWALTIRQNLYLDNYEMPDRGKGGNDSNGTVVETFEERGKTCYLLVGVLRSCRANGALAAFQFDLTFEHDFLQTRPNPPCIFHTSLTKETFSYRYRSREAFISNQSLLKAERWLFAR